VSDARRYEDHGPGPDRLLAVTAEVVTGPLEYEPHLIERVVVARDGKQVSPGPQPNDAPAGDQRSRSLVGAGAPRIPMLQVAIGSTRLRGF
jgi:hypothetical protein